MSANSSGHWQLSAKSVAVGSFMVTLASLATLVTVVSVKNVDTLSTVALVLAVLAFVVQLIVFVVQSAAADAQHRNAQELHAAMMATLSQIQERTHGTQASVERINSRLLDAALGKASSEGFELGTPEYAEVVARTLSTANASSVNRDPSTGPDSDEPRRTPIRSNYPPPMAKEEAEPLHQEMTTWPSPAEMPAILKDLSSLSNHAQQVLLRLADDLARCTRPGSPIGPGAHSLSKELRDEGLVRKIPGWKLDILTEEGRRIGRVLSAYGPPPKNAPTELIELVERIRSIDEEQTRAMLDNRDPD